MSNSDIILQIIGHRLDRGSLPKNTILVGMQSFSDRNPELEGTTAKPALSNSSRVGGPGRSLYATQNDFVQSARTPSSANVDKVRSTTERMFACSSSTTLVCARSRALI